MVTTLKRKHRAHVSVALLPVGSTGAPWTTVTFRNGPAWSTSKVPLAMAARRKYPRGPLTAARVIRDGGDRTTTVPSVRKRRGFTIFGQTAWAPASQVRFVASLRLPRPTRIC